MAATSSSESRSALTTTAGLREAPLLAGSACAGWCASASSAAENCSTSVVLRSCEDLTDDFRHNALCMESGEPNASCARDCVDRGGASGTDQADNLAADERQEIGRASCRERV